MNEQNKKTILCFGDSNTHGYDPATIGRYSYFNRYPGRLQELLGDAYLVIEEGLSGRTTSIEDPLFEGLSGLDYIYPCLMSHEPVDLLIIMLGTNDTKARFSLTPGNIAKGMERLVTKAKNAPVWRSKPNILIISPPHILPKYKDVPMINVDMGEGCAEKSALIAGYYKAVAELTGCRFLDANSLDGVEMSDIDCMHLSSSAHRALAMHLSALIPDML